MRNLLKAERYDLMHNRLLWCTIILYAVFGVLNGLTNSLNYYGPKAIYYIINIDGIAGTAGPAMTLGDTFMTLNMDSTIFIISIVSIQAFILGKGFANRTMNLEITAGHTRLKVFLSKLITYWSVFNLVLLVYPVTAIIAYLNMVPVTDPANELKKIAVICLYSIVLNGAFMMQSVLISFIVKNALGSMTITLVSALMQTLGFIYLYHIFKPLAYLPITQWRIALSHLDTFHPGIITIGVIWTAALGYAAWRCFRKAEMK